MLKSLHQVDRPSFWMWSVPIVIVHVLFAIAAANGIGLGPLGTIDNLLILLLAAVLAGRFRDIGWPVWIGASFPLVTMVAIPLGILLLAVASGERGRDIAPWMLLIGWFTGPANLLLLVVAGCMPGKIIDPEPVAPSS